MAHEGLWEQLEKLNGQEAAKRAKCKYLSDPERYVVRMLNAEYTVNPSEREIYAVKGDSQPALAEFLEQLCLLAYLINARDLPLAERLVSAEALPGGQFFFRGPHSLPTGKLTTAFGDNPELLYRVTQQFDAKRCEFGDASVELYVLPRILLTVVIWRGDEEFDARASILFDRTAASHLPLDALLAAVNLMVKALVEAAEASGPAAAEEKC